MTKDLSPRAEALIIACLTGQGTDAERREFEKRINSDPNFSQQVDALEDWLAPLDQDIDHIEPPETLLNQIMEKIAPEKHVDTVRYVTSSAATPTPHSTRLWRAAAIAASLIAVASIALHLTPQQRQITLVETPAAEPDVQPSFLALLSVDVPSPLVAIIYNPETGQVVARLSNVEVPEDGDLQLWLIREGAPGPVSLGLLERAENGQVEIKSSEVLNPALDVLAVSLEAPGGSASTGPEGPILFSGPVTQL
ncbi:anti-sigma factor [Algimonas porphyrae]|uniref:anti-sigma factor n=1 Tax=Algimonas porphyrae TaxID=1128113 RepID=UPI00352A646A